MTIPEGYVLVPREPTEAMWTAGRAPVMYRDMKFYRPPGLEVPAWQINPDGTVETDTSKGTTAVHVWRAMIAAAPTPPVGQSELPPPPEPERRPHPTVPYCYFTAAQMHEYGRACAGAAGSGWQPIETAPKDGRTMLLGCFNGAGKWRTMRGEWMSDEQIAEEWEFPENGEAGWYETSVEAEDAPTCWCIKPTHWMPLPPAPPAAMTKEPQ